MRKDLEELPLQFVGSCFLNRAAIPNSKAYWPIVPWPVSPRYTHSSVHTHPPALQSFLGSVTNHVIFHGQSSDAAEVYHIDPGKQGYLTQCMPLPEEVCQDLSTTRHVLYLQNKEGPLKSWLLLDLPTILHNVYENLCSQPNIVNEFGLLPSQYLHEFFPHLEIIQQLLISLEFFIPMDPLVLKMELSKPTQSNEASGWLFCPALISSKPPLPSEYFCQKSVCYLVGSLEFPRNTPFQYVQLFHFACIPVFRLSTVSLEYCGHLTCTLWCVAFVEFAL